MDGPFWVDLRAPHMSADAASVTLSTTNKAIIPIANLPILGANYFGFVGKAVRMRIWGQMTAVSTPGNLQLGLYWGNGTDANGTNVLAVAAAAAQALTAGTALSWEWDVIVRCRALGTSGSVMAHGMFNANPSLIAASLQPIMMPASAAATTTIDTTANNVLSPQLAASGSAGTAVVVHEFTWEALN